MKSSDSTSLTLKYIALVAVLFLVVGVAYVSTSSFYQGKTISDNSLTASVVSEPDLLSSPIPSEGSEDVLISESVMPTSTSLPPTRPGLTTPATASGQNTSVQIIPVSTSHIKYTLPEGWEAEDRDRELFISTGKGGYLVIKAYKYSPQTGRREFFCKVSVDLCAPQTTFSAIQIGNLNGYVVHSPDNSGGGAEYFGAKGNTFYWISMFSPSYPTPNEFDLHIKELKDSLQF